MASAPVKRHLGHGSLSHGSLGHGSAQGAIVEADNEINLAAGLLDDAAQGGLHLATPKSFTINLCDVNEAPSDATLTGGSVAENSANGTTVGTVTGTDPDAGDVLSYALLDTAGGRFAINASSGAISVANGALLDFESNTSHNVTVRVTDHDGLFIDKTFTIGVTNVIEPPVTTPVQNSTLEDTLATIAQVTAPEGGPVTLTNVTGINNGVNGTVSLLNGNITYRPNANFSGIAEFDYTVSDARGNTTTAHATLDVSPVADPVLLAGQVVTSHADGRGQFQLALCQTSFCHQSRSWPTAGSLQRSTTPAEETMLGSLTPSGVGSSMRTAPPPPANSWSTRRLAAMTYA